MNKITTIFILLLLISACNKSDTEVYGDLTEMNRKVDTYHQIIVGDGIPVTITEGEQDDIVVRTFTSVFEYVETFVEDEVLYIRVSDDVNNFNTNPNISVKLTNETITKLVANGQNKVATIGNVFDSDTLYLEIAHSSFFTGKINSNKTSIKIEYSSTVDAQNSVIDSLVLNVSDSEFKGKYFTTRALNAVLLEESTAYLEVIEKIVKANLRNKSKLHYIGKDVELITNEIYYDSSSEFRNVEKF